MGCPNTAPPGKGRHPRALLGSGDIRVAAGNYRLLSADVRHQSLESPQLAHLPFTAVEQLSRKAVLGAWSTSERVDGRIGDKIGGGCVTR
ncbi:MAG: hypothetical protein R2720_10050 [Candidatus Nanopelagicales bacterium]